MKYNRVNKSKKIGKIGAFFILLSLLCSSMSFFVINGTATSSTIEINEENQQFIESNINEKTESFDNVNIQEQNSEIIGLSSESQIKIISPEIGYSYDLTKGIITQKRILGWLGYALVIDNKLDIEATTINTHHVEFEAIKLLTKQKTVLIDDIMVDGCNCNFQLSTGIYKVNVKAYDKNDHEIAHDSIKILFIKSKSQVGDFGVWIRTEYKDSVSTQKLDIGLIKFVQMLKSEEWEQFSIKLENPGDTTVNIRFSSTIKNIEGVGYKKVFQTEFFVKTNCDTSKKYSVSLEVRFPFSLLKNKAKTKPYVPATSSESYFSMRIGFSSPNGNEGPSVVHTVFYFGKDNLLDPIALGLKITPNNAGESDVTFFGSLVNVDSSGNEVFRRIITVDFQPAAELEITFIPRNGRTIYNFGSSVGVLTKISFNTEGGLGLLEKIVYSIVFAPLPSDLNFDINILHEGNLFEFYYDCESEYNIEFLLESISEEDDSSISLEFGEIPQTIYFSCDLSIEDQAAEVGFHFDMSSDLGYGKFAMQVGDFSTGVEVYNLPYDIDFEGLVNVQTGKGDIDFLWKSKDYFYPNITAFINYKTWTITGGAIFKNKNIHISWDINSATRDGNIYITRPSIESEYSTFFVSIIYDEWKITDTFELKNKATYISWNLPTTSNSDVSLNIKPYQGVEFHNTLSIEKGSIELLYFDLTLKTDDNFHIEWEYDSNDNVKNFYFSGNILKALSLYIKVNYKNVDFEIYGEWTFGDQTGSFGIKFNKDLTITPINIENNKFKFKISLTILKNSQMNFYWKLIEGTQSDPGYFMIDTGGQSAGAALNFDFEWDPANTHDYKWGFDVTAVGTIKVDDFKVKWWKSNGFRWNWSGTIYGSLYFYPVWILWNGDWKGAFSIP